MDKSRWLEVAAIAEQALALGVSEREGFIAEQVKAKPEIAEDLAAVIAASTDPDEFATDLSEQLGKILERESFIKGRTFGPYEIRETLGWGGMGAVYLADRADKQFKKTVALKVLPQITDDRATRDRFIEERQILAGLEHPSIARLIDGGVTDLGQPYFALEYVDGKLSSAFADDEDTTLSDVLDVFHQVCEAVAYAHARLLVHCDIKPSNVLVDAEKRARLIDFGIARVVAQSGVPRLPADYLETPLTKNYASPELLRGEAVDASTDVFSLGNLLYRLLVGTQRYQLSEESHDPSSEIRKAAVTGALAATGKLQGASRTVRHELASIIARATEADASKRYTSVAELAADIVRFQSHEALVPSPPVPLYRLRKSSRRNPLATIFAATTVLLMLATIAVLVASLLRTRTEREVAKRAEKQARLAAETSDRVIDYLVDIFESPDRRDPESNMDTTARELIERGLRLGAATSGEKQVAARLDLAIGRAGVGLGSFRDAAVVLERAVAGPLDEKSRTVALLSLVQAYQGLSDHQRASEATKQVTTACEATGDRWCLASLHSINATAQDKVGDYPRAEESLRNALSVLETNEAPTPAIRALTTSTLFNLGAVLHKTHRYRDAAPLFERAITLHQETRGPPTSGSADAYSQMGMFHNARGNFAEARKHLETAREHQSVIKGPRHPDVASVERFLSNALHELGEVEAALAVIESALSIQIERLAPDDIRTSYSWSQKGVILNRLGRLEEARAALVSARAISKTKKPSSYIRQGMSLAVVLAKLGNATEALAVANGSLELKKTLGGRASSHAATAITEQEMGFVHRALGDAEAAIASFEAALVGSETLRADHPRRAKLLLDIGRLQTKLGKHAEAKTTLERARKLADIAMPRSEQLIKNIAEASVASTR